MAERIRQVMRHCLNLATANATVLWDRSRYLGVELVDGVQRVTSGEHEARGPLPGASPESGREMRTNGGSGRRSSESFARFDPDTRSWRTSRACLPGMQEWTRSSVRWPNSGSMRSGRCYRRPRWEPRIDESESSSWPTAHASASTGPGRGGRQGGPNLQTEAATWPTATAGDAKASGSRNAPGSAANQGVSLSDMVRTGDSKGRTTYERNEYPTPTQHYGSNSGGEGEGPERPSLETWARREWATPAARDWKSEDPEQSPEKSPPLGRQVPQTPKGGDESCENDQISLPLWLTPHGFQAGNGSDGNEFSKSVRSAPWATPTSHERTNRPRKVDHGEQLANQVDEGASEGAGLTRLNPRFVEWLMGFPPGHTEARLPTSSDEP